MAPPDIPPEEIKDQPDLVAFRRARWARLLAELEQELGELSDEEIALAQKLFDQGKTHKAILKAIRAARNAGLPAPRSQP